MKPLLRSLAAPFLSLILLILASGLCNTFISVRLEIEGYSPAIIGSVTAALYAGIFAGSIWMDRWISKMGHIKSFIVFAFFTMLLTLIQSVWVNPYFWIVLRFLGGICTAGIFIVIESWLLIRATPMFRGAILSIYLAIFYGALSAGQLLINLADPTTANPFYIISVLTALSILPMATTSIPQPKIEPGVRLSSTELFKISPFGLIGVVVSGILLAAVYGLMPVYAKEIGMTVPEIGDLMALLIFGGLSFQWPLGRLADKSNRRGVLIGTSVLTFIICCTIALSGHLSPTLFLILMFFFGGFAFTIYPLSMAHACEKIKEDQIVSATGGFVLSYGIGAIAGPIMAPIAMNCLGSNGLFYFLALIVSVLILAGCKKQRKDYI
jgi:MFS family permease